MSGKTRREYSNLDSVFNKLQVSSSSTSSLAGCSEGRPSIENTTSESLRITESTSMSIGERLKNKRRKKTTKCIVKKAKLILPKTFTTTSTTVKKRRGAVTLNKQKNNQEEDEDEEDVDKEEDEVFLDNSSDSDVSITETPGTPSSCSAQYLSTVHSVADPNTDSSNAEELAAYFEQMLFIPKPMSLMAQMMYA